MKEPDKTRAGIGLKPAHYADLLDAMPYHRPGWVEVHPQNYWGPSSDRALAWLSRIAAELPVSFHSVGLSLGSAGGLNVGELDRLVKLCAAIPPLRVSDHLSFSGNAHDRLADLLPLPYTFEALDHFAAQVARVQDRLGRQLLIENPARYLAYRHQDMDEIPFLERLVARTGCGLLLDINNIVVTCGNLGGSAADYLAAIDPAWVGEVHLAGHTVQAHDSGPFLIDDHGSAVSDEVWTLYADFIARAGPKPTLIEWDTNVPDYATLMAEVAKADSVMEVQHAFA